MTDELPIVSLDAFTLFPGLPACEGLTLDLVQSTPPDTNPAPVPGDRIDDGRVSRMGK